MRMTANAIGADGALPVPDRAEAEPRVESPTAEAAKLGARAAHRAAVRRAKAKDPRRDPLFWPANQKDALLKRITWEEKLLSHRFDGAVNIFPHLVSKIPFQRLTVEISGKPQQVTRREFAELKLKEARALLEAKGDTLSTEDTRQVLRLIERAHTRGIRKFDTFLDDFTETGFSNVVSLLVTGLLEWKNYRLETQGKARLDSKGNIKGKFISFIAKYVPYLSGVYASRGRNCLHEVNPDTTLKYNPAFVNAEVKAAVIMVAGSQLGAYALEHWAQLGRGSANLLSGVAAGLGAGYYCYWLINRDNELAANSSPVRGMIRAGINVPIRQSMGPALSPVVRFLDRGVRWFSGLFRAAAA
ncbi:MAG: hypothetical protein ACKVPX_13110 [Myxococcaceae bacterium]